MAPRFPIGEAPDPASTETLNTQLSALHQGQMPTVEEDGSALLGWSAALSYAPNDVIRGFMELSKASYMPNHIKPRNQELAVLAFISVTQVPWMREVHSLSGAKNPAMNFTPEQIQDGLAGNLPQGLSEEEQAAYRLGKILTSLNGPLDEETWKDSSSKLSKSEIVGIANFVGVFHWLALLIRLKG